MQGKISLQNTVHSCTNQAIWPICSKVILLEIDIYIDINSFSRDTSCVINSYKLFIQKQLIKTQVTLKCLLDGKVCSPSSPTKTRWAVFVCVQLM